MQFGFRVGHSYLFFFFIFFATLKVINDIVCAMERREYCAVVFVDVSKASDSVDHHILLDRFRDTGLSESCVAWFKAIVWLRTVGEG